MRILILEDNADRQKVMSEVLGDLFPKVVIQFFAVSRELIDHLSSTGIYDVALISLDNDLDMLKAIDGSTVDAGDGLEVAKWVTTKPPVMPVVIHTTNAFAGDKMETMLGENGWILARVVPYDGENWIRERWRSVVRNLIVAITPDVSVSSVGVQLLKHGLQRGDSISDILREVMRVGALRSRGAASADAFFFELAYLSGTDVLTSIVAEGNSLLSEIGPGATREVVECSAGCFGIGPVTPDHESIEPLFRRLMAQQSVLEIQFDVVQPVPGSQAVLLTGSRSPQLNLNSHGVQAAIREVKSLIELGLLVAIRESLNDLDELGLPNVWSAKLTDEDLE